MSQSGALLTLLVDKFLHTTHLAVARLCDMIACRRVEMLLAENIQVGRSSSWVGEEGGGDPRVQVPAHDAPRRRAPL